MAFYGSHFIFDGKSSEEFGLMLYTFNGNGQEDVTLTTSSEIHSEKLATRFRNHLYGVENNEPLTFKLVFGTIPDEVNSESVLDREDIADVAAWLTGHSTYKYLQICQPDMENYRFRCLITNLTVLTDGTYPWAYECQVICDSPYAYTHNQSYTIESAGEESEITIFSPSTHNGYYYPRMDIIPSADGDIEITNVTDNNRTFILKDMKLRENYEVDNENQILTVTNLSRSDQYDRFNFKFFRLVRGDNKIKIKGNALIVINCEYPVNIGA